MCSTLRDGVPETNCMTAQTTGLLGEAKSCRRRGDGPNKSRVMKGHGNSEVAGVFNETFIYFQHLS